MAWENTHIEKRMHESLLSGEQIARSLGEELYAGYIMARQKLCEEILPEIKAVEKSLTDHGPRHIMNVLENMDSLLEKEFDRVSHIELYLLCLLALFHDVGNINGRKGHFDRKVIYQIYDYIRNGDSKFDIERNIVATIASTHSGKAPDGSLDTIKQLSDSKIGFHSKGIDSRKLAAILRLADELAEGPQRTSNFMYLQHKYDPQTHIYHDYARCKQVFIDKGNGRVALTYLIKLKRTKPKGEISKKDVENTKELLDYIYKRIIKVNQERVYNKYYCLILGAFSVLSVSIEFEIDGIPFDIGLKDLIINDLQIPGDGHKLITEFDKSYEISKIIKALNNKKSKNAKRPKPI